VEVWSPPLYCPVSVVRRNTVVNIPTTPYDTVVSTRPRSTTPADLHRLAGVARERGIRLYQERATGAWYSTSATDANACYYVTGYSCTCAGFVYHQQCSHHAALLARLGWLPAVAGATTNVVAAVAPPCARCRGRGFTYAEAGPDQWPYEIPCAACAPQDDDDPDDGGGRWNDDIAESCPDDSSRFAAVAARYLPDHAA